MADQQEWPTERLRALDRAVAEARGQVVAFDMPDGCDGPKYPWIYIGGDKAPLPCYSKGCRETFELQREKSIDVRHMCGGQVRAIGEPYDYDAEMEQVAPTVPIAICLAYLAAKGRAFNG